MADVFRETWVRFCARDVEKCLLCEFIPALGDFVREFSDIQSREQTCSRRPSDDVSVANRRKRGKAEVHQDGLLQTTARKIAKTMPFTMSNGPKG